MNKFLKAFSILIICLFFLSIFGWMSVQISKGEKDFGILEKPITFMYSFFDTFEESVEELQKLPPTFLPTPESHSPINKLKHDILVFFSYSERNNKRALAIKNLKSDSILQNWLLPDSIADHDRVVNPMLLPNQDIIYGIDMRTGLRRIDKEGKVLWKQDSIRIHHAFNLDSSGNIWTCSSNLSYDADGSYILKGSRYYYKDDYISHIDIKTGKLLFHRSISEILTVNGISDYLLQSPSGDDPIHLNDIQPALKTTKYYHEGDVFLSSKSMSMIIHYRPKTNKIIQVIRGPFSAQHDVDFYNDSTLTLFNNNFYPYGVHILGNSLPEPKEVKNLKDAGTFVTNIMQFDFKTGTVSKFEEELFRTNNIFTMTEGLHEFINDSTYFVEQQNNGYIWVIQNHEVVYKNVFPSQHEGHHHLPNWTRIISE